MKNVPRSLDMDTSKYSKASRYVHVEFKEPMYMYMSGKCTDLSMFLFARIVMALVEESLDNDISKIPFSRRSIHSPNTVTRTAT